MDGLAADAGRTADDRDNVAILDAPGEFENLCLAVPSFAHLLPLFSLGGNVALANR